MLTFLKADTLKTKKLTSTSSFKPGKTHVAILPSPISAFRILAFQRVSVSAFPPVRFISAFHNSIFSFLLSAFP
jgi:hypothetical protein